MNWSSQPPPDLRQIDGGVRERNRLAAQLRRAVAARLQPVLIDAAVIGVDQPVLRHALALVERELERAVALGGRRGENFNDEVGDPAQARSQHDVPALLEHDDVVALDDVGRSELQIDRSIEYLAATGKLDLPVQRELNMSGRVLMVGSGRR